MQKSYTAARERAAFLDRSDRGRIVVSGVDRRSYLQGLLTNDVAALRSGSGCYAAYLTAQGRMIADMFVYELGDVVMVTVVRDVKDTVVAKFDQFIFSEDVQLGDVTDTFAQVGIVGPDAASVVADVLPEITGETLRKLATHDNVRASFAGVPAIVTRTTDVGEPGFDLFVSAEQRDALLTMLRGRGIAELTPSDADTLRIEARVPLFHVDMDEDTIPLEAGIEERAISFTKGCYVGQEVIIRVMHRGHGRVAKKLVQLRIEGSDVPSRDAAVRGADKDIGRVTSATFSPRLNQPIALAYVHRDFVERGTTVTVNGARASVA